MIKFNNRNLQINLINKKKKMNKIKYKQSNYIVNKYNKLNKNYIKNKLKIINFNQIFKNIKNKINNNNKNI